jgi:KaiC/GvpD/RAD55 family RecA-like ATPase
MYQKFLTARSPVRVLEKGLHGGLGKGNLGLVLAGHGIGKTSFLVGVALDELLRGGHVLHVAIDQTVAHTRAHYDTLFDELASHARLDDAPVVHADVDRRRSIRAVTSGSFGSAKLREAVKLQQEMGSAPALVILENFDAARARADELADMKALAQEIGAEIWLSVACPGGRSTAARSAREARDASA